MATDALNFYDDFKLQLGLERHQLNSDTIRAALFTSTHTPVVATDVSYSSLTNEVSNTMNGYTTTGLDITNTYTESPDGTGLLSASTVVWTAGANWTDNIRYVVFYNATAGGTNDLIGYVDYVATPVTLSSGETFTVTFASGLFTLT